jgi:hypothetical protein
MFKKSAKSKMVTGHTAKFKTLNYLITEFYASKINFFLVSTHLGLFLPNI